jgi:hypothetical protein
MPGMTKMMIMVEHYIFLHRLASLVNLKKVTEVNYFGKILTILII